jgi:hypothetical protein
MRVSGCFAHHVDVAERKRPQPERPGGQRGDDQVRGGRVGGHVAEHRTPGPGTAIDFLPGG